MKYLLLIYGAPEAEPQTPEAVQELVDEYWAYEAAAEDAGVFIASQALQGVETATTVQVRDDGERIVTDGPFAETRELLAGFNLINARDEEEAMRIARGFPWARYGSLEVRPVADMEAERRRVGA